MMKHPRLTGSIAALAIAPLALAACSGGGDGGANGGGDAGASDGATTLTVVDYYNNEPDNTVITGVLDACAAEIGVTIKRTAIPGKDLIQKVLQMASSRTLPDVLMLDNPDVQEIATTGGLAPLGDFDIDTTGFAPGMLDAATYEGELYGLAPVANTLALFYNEDLLAAKGIEPPKTWDELKTAAKALTEGDTYGVAFSAIATYEGSWQFLPFMWTNGGDETDLTSPEVAQALQLWADVVGDGSASKSVINWSQADVKDQFAAGKAAMMVNGPWQIPSLDDTDGLNWGVVQVPVNTVGQTPVAPLGGEVWTIPQTGNAERQQKAAELITCINTPDNQMTIATQRNTIPTRTDLADAYVAEKPDMAAFTAQVADARSRTGKLGAAWPKAATEIYTAIQLALTGQATAEEAFEKAAAG